MRSLCVVLSVLFVCAPARAEPPTASFPPPPAEPGVAAPAQPPPAVTPPPRGPYGWCPPPRAPYGWYPPPRGPYGWYPPPAYVPAGRRPAPPPDPPRWDRRRFAVLGQFGFGTPLGLAGVWVEANAAPWFSLAAGLGAGGRAPGVNDMRLHPVKHPSSLQLAAMARLRWPFHTLAISAGAGLSEGGYETLIGGPFGDETESGVYIWDHARWFNFDFALEGRTKTGLEWRAFAGSERLLNHARADRCSPPNSVDSCSGSEWNGWPVSLFTIGFAIGYAFDL